MIEPLCHLLGYSKQAYYKSLHACRAARESDEYVLSIVRDTREEMPNLGVTKLWKILNKNNLVIGRDRLHVLLRENGMLIKRKRYTPRTTDSRGWLHRHDNLVKGLKITKPNQVWVSDITYLPTLAGFMYLSLVTDAYSRKIMGSHVHEYLDASGPLEALNVAIQACGASSLDGLIHHSDRGTQYCSETYTKVLIDNGIKISTTQDGSPYDNAIAERVNGILKREWLNDTVLTGLSQAREKVKHAVNLYNTRRPHYAVGLNPPQEVHVTKDERFKYVMF